MVNGAAAQAPAASAVTDRLVPTVAPIGPITGEVDLGREVPAMKGYRLVQRLTTVPPHTGRPLHSHAGVPEIVRIISGHITEVRNGQPAATFGPGTTLVNADGLKHMWANLGDEPATFIGTQVVPLP
jgi:quercetin dioxygenase-like cupin family protein